MKIEYQKQAQGSFLILGEMEQASAFFLQMLAEMRYRDFFHAVCRILTEKRDFPMQSVGAVWRHLQKDRL